MGESLFIVALSGLFVTLVTEVSKKTKLKKEYVVLFLTAVASIGYVTLKQFTPEHILENLVSFGLQVFGVSTAIYVYLIKIVVKK